MVGGRVAGGDANTAGKIGHCLEGFVVWGEKFRRMCCSVLRLLAEWCGGCEAAVAALLAAPSHLPLLVDMVRSNIMCQIANCG
jgi:hypothetical protein